MAKAAKEKLLERVVVGPKPIHAQDKDGNRYVAQVGDTVYLPPHTAKTFARYLADPKVAKAQAAAKQAEEASAADETAETPAPAAASDEGGGSDES